MKKPNIIILVLDALRTQNMSTYGYDKNTTPYLDKISKQATLYKNAIASSYWTLPSTASLFTGTYTSTHYLIRNGDKLDNKYVTLPEYLNKKGYQCIGLSPNPFVSKYSKLDRGFHIFDDYYKESIKHKLNDITEHFFEGSSGDKKDGQINKIYNKISDYDVFKQFYWMITGNFDKFATSINKKIKYYLQNRSKNKPFFIYAHYTETHSPYVVPNKFRSKFIDDKDTKPWRINQDYFNYYTSDEKLNEKEFNIIRSIYDGTISYLDEKVYDIYTYLEKNNLLKDTILIITSDHGDQLGEKKLFFHVFSLYDTLVKIPLIIKFDDNTRIDSIENNIVQNTDIFPTILNLLNEKNQDINRQIQGNSLLNKKNQKRGDYAISELYKPFGPRLIKYRHKLKQFDKKLLAIRNNEKKYIYSSNGMHELYDIKYDKLEKDNLYNNNFDLEKDFKNNEVKDWITTFNLVSKYDKSINDIEKEILFRIK